MTNLIINRGNDGGEPVLKLEGRLTLGEGSRELRGLISDVAAEGHKVLQLDLAKVSYVDSSGLGALVAGYNTLKAQGGSVRLLNVPPRVQALLEMSGLTGLFRDAAPVPGQS
jgi:anti-sigma B factor antagonist